MLRTRWPVALFVLWSGYVWVTRIVNAAADDAANKPFAFALSLSVLVPAAAVGVVLVRARERELTAGEARLGQALAAWTTAVWLVRAIEITLADHEPAFKIVHVALGVVSIVLAGATVRVVRRQTAGEAAPPVGAGRR